MESVFGDDSFFSEFERDRPASDEILKRSIECENVQRQNWTNRLNSEPDNGESASQSGDNSQESFAPEPFGFSELNNHASLSNIEYIRKLENEVEQLKSINILLSVLMFIRFW